MSEVIDLNLNLTPPEVKGLQHERHGDHTHFYYQQWELENSPVANPEKFTKEWIELSIVYNSEGCPFEVKIKELLGK